MEKKNHIFAVISINFIVSFYGLSHALFTVGPILFLNRDYIHLLMTSIFGKKFPRLHLASSFRVLVYGPAFRVTIIDVISATLWADFCTRSRSALVNSLLHFGVLRGLLVRKNLWSNAWSHFFLQIPKCMFVRSRHVFECAIVRLTNMYAAALKMTCCLRRDLGVVK